MQARKESKYDKEIEDLWIKVRSEGTSNLTEREILLLILDTLENLKKERT